LNVPIVGNESASLIMRTQVTCSPKTGQDEARNVAYSIMRKSKLTEEQIVYALKQAELGVAVLDVCRKYGVSEQTFYRWRKKYGGLEAGELRRLKQLEDENRKLKELVADLSLDKHVLQDVIAKKL
jgi:putative transposase